jgi:hypothetical protein
MKWEQWVKLGRELPEVEEGMGCPVVLARLAKLRVAESRRRLEQGWRLKAPKALVKQRLAASDKPSARR